MDRKSISIPIIPIVMVLAVLKLTVWPTLSWWWVFSPFLATLSFMALVIGWIIIAFVFGGPVKWVSR